MLALRKPICLRVIEGGDLGGAGREPKRVLSTVQARGEAEDAEAEGRESTYLTPVAS